MLVLVAFCTLLRALRLWISYTCIFLSVFCSCVATKFSSEWNKEVHDLTEHFETKSLSFMRFCLFVFWSCCCCFFCLFFFVFFWGGGGGGLLSRISVTSTRWSMAGVLGTEPALRRASFLKDPKLSSLSAKKKQIKVLWMCADRRLVLEWKPLVSNKHFSVLC